MNGKISAPVQAIMNYVVYSLGNDPVSISAGTDKTIPFNFVRHGNGLYPEYRSSTEKIIVRETGTYLVYAKYQLNGRIYENTVIDVELQLWRDNEYINYSAFDFYTPYSAAQMTVFRAVAGDEIRATILNCTENITFTGYSRTELVIVRLG